MIDVTRRGTPPASLAADDRYDGADVVEALHADFCGKCYLCETKILPGTFTIDHRRPQGERQFPELRYTMLVRSRFSGSPVARALFDDAAP